MTLPTASAALSSHSSYAKFSVAFLLTIIFSLKVKHILFTYIISPVSIIFGKIFDDDKVTKFELEFLVRWPVEKKNGTT